MKQYGFKRWDCKKMIAGEKIIDPKTHYGISQNSIDKDKKLIKKIIATAIIAVFLPTFQVRRRMTKAYYKKRK